MLFNATFMTHHHSDRIHCCMLSEGWDITGVTCIYSTPIEKFEQTTVILYSLRIQQPYIVVYEKHIVYTDIHNQCTSFSSYVILYCI